eukprot:gene685-732_t
MSDGNSNSAAHWCKTVIEDAVPTLKTNASAILTPQAPASSYSSTFSSLLGSTSAASVSATASSVAGVNPAYLQYYQQYYGASTIPSATTTVATPSVTTVGNTFTPAAVSAASIAANANAALLNYKAALTQNLPISNPAAQAWNGGYYSATVVPTQTSANNTALSSSSYSLPAKATSTTTFVAPTVDLVGKKPNPSRFAAAPTTTQQQSMNIPQSTPASATAPKPKQKAKQPASLTEFLSRAIMSCTSEEERVFRTTEIQKLINKVTQEGRLQVHRWDLEPIPIYEPPVHQNPSSFHISSSTSDLPNQNYHQSSSLSIDTETAQDSYLVGKKRKSRWGETSMASPELSERSKALTEQPLFNLAPDTLFNPMTGKKTSLAGVNSLLTAEELKMREKRAHRFQQQQSNHEETNSHKKQKPLHKSVSAPIINTDGEFDMESLRIVGTCQRLEKDYLRLTSAPLPNVVRPEEVLRKSIQLIKKKWDNDEVDYIYMCSQLKSIRQDLTVQHIQNDFTVHIYETHARVALESSDLNEYNQCQTQLKQLYAAGIKGNEREFIAYRILYYIYLLGNKKYTAGSSDLAYILTQLKDEEMKDEAVDHALKIRKAIHAENYHRFFQLYKKTPNMGVCILDLMLESMRVKFLQRMLKAYRPMTVSVSFVLEELAFEEEVIGMDFLKRLGCVLQEKVAAVAETGESSSDAKEDPSSTKKDWIWNTKDSSIDPSALVTEQKLLL